MNLLNRKMIVILTLLFAPVFVNAQQKMSTVQFTQAEKWLTYFAVQASLKNPDLRFRELIKMSLIYDEDRQKLSGFLSNENPLSKLKFKFIYNELWIINDQNEPISKLTLLDNANTYLINGKKFQYDKTISISKQLSLFFSPMKKPKRSAFFEFFIISNLYAEFCILDACAKNRDLNNAMTSVLSSLVSLAASNEKFIEFLKTLPPKADVQDASKINCPASIQKDELTVNTTVEGKKYSIRNFVERDGMLYAEIKDASGNVVAFYSNSTTDGVYRKTNASKQISKHLALEYLYSHNPDCKNHISSDDSSDDSSDGRSYGRSYGRSDGRSYDSSDGRSYDSSDGRSYDRSATCRQEFRRILKGIFTSKDINLNISSLNLDLIIPPSEKESSIFVDITRKQNDLAKYIQDKFNATPEEIKNIELGETSWEQIKRKYPGTGSGAFANEATRKESEIEQLKNKYLALKLERQNQAKPIINGFLDLNVNTLSLRACCGSIVCKESIYKNHKIDLVTPQTGRQ